MKLDPGNTELVTQKQKLLADAVGETKEKADYSTAMKDILDEYNKSGSWDSYLSMDNWQQSIKDYT